MFYKWQYNGNENSHKQAANWIQGGNHSMENLIRPRKDKTPGAYDNIKHEVEKGGFLVF